MQNNKQSPKIKFLSPEEIKKTERENSLVGMFGYKIIILSVIGLFYVIKNAYSGLENFLAWIFFVAFCSFILLKSGDNLQLVDKDEIDKKGGYWVWGWTAASFPSPTFVTNPTPLFLIRFIIWVIFLTPLILFLMKNLNIINFSII